MARDSMLRDEDRSHGGCAPAVGELAYGEFGGIGAARGNHNERAGVHFRGAAQSRKAAAEVVVEVRRVKGEVLVGTRFGFVEPEPHAVVIAGLLDELAVLQDAAIFFARAVGGSGLRGG